MSAPERNIPLTEIVSSATAAAESGALATCPYPRGSAAAWCWMHAHAAVVSALIIDWFREFHTGRKSNV
jgi:hypothetical protein